MVTCRARAVTSRARNGSPGVNLVTPMRVAGSDTLVLVNRGWVYSPDGASVRVEDWREPDTATVTGYVEPLGAGRGSGAIVGRPTALRWLERGEVERRVGAPVAPFILVQTEGGAAPADTVPPRHALPQLDEGGAARTGRDVRGARCLLRRRTSHASRTRHTGTACGS